MYDQPHSELADLAADISRPAIDPQAARRLLREWVTSDERALLDDPERWIDAFVGRGGGKSAAGVALCADTALAYPDPSTLITYGALTKDSSRENVWAELRRLDAELGLGVHFHDTHMRAIFPGGARFSMRSLETRHELNKLRGKQYRLIVLDEMQSIQDEVIVYALTKVIPATLSRYRGRVLALGTAGEVAEGVWHSITCKQCREPRPDARGQLRVFSRPYVERDDPKWTGVAYTWSHHGWARSSNQHLEEKDEEVQRRHGWTPDSREWILEYLPDWIHETVEAEQLIKCYGRFDAERDVWDPGPSSKDNPYGLPGAHNWRYVLGVDLGGSNPRNDPTAFALAASALTSRVAYECDDDEKYEMVVEDIAKKVQRYQEVLGHKLVAVVVDTQGRRGSEIAEELATRYAIPITRAKKADKEDWIELLNSDFEKSGVKVLRGGRLPRQYERLTWAAHKPGHRRRETPGQRNDVADAFLYCYKHLLHRFARDPARAPTAEEQRRTFEAKQANAMRHQAARVEEWGRLRPQAFNPKGTDW